ncbi:aldo/keto reductase [Kibdelosporangium aridum]|uniref:aldo/keto reductase n=1 Tax=Kibdelosporangium aridum TaxID=2030 RepID=UPI000566D0EC|nr:aldo/keto reductase [Kibdelosporangium aridum]
MRGYTLLDHSALDTFLPACEERGVSVIAASVFNSGLLAVPRPGEGAFFDYEAAAPDVLERANKIADVREVHGVTLPQVAMAFPCNVLAQVWTDLRAAGLIR